MAEYKVVFDAHPVDSRAKRPVGAKLLGHIGPSWWINKAFQPKDYNNDSAGNSPQVSGTIGGGLDTGSGDFGL